MDRRTFIGALGSVAITPSLYASFSTEGHGVVWGGLGFSCPAADVKTLFPFASSAIRGSGGFSELTSSFVKVIEESYKGEGLLLDQNTLIDLDELGGGLIFLVSIDKEFVNRIPSGLDQQKEHVTAYLFASAQVLTIAEAGTIDLLYSFPFRISRSGVSTKGDVAALTDLFIEALYIENDGLVEVFRKKVASKSFRERMTRKRVRVSDIAFSEFSKERFGGIGAEALLKRDFWGNVVTSALSEVVPESISVLPYKSNDALSQGLANRFQSTRVWNMLSFDDLDVDYRVSIKVDKGLRKSNGSSATSVLYTRGLSFWVVIHDHHGDEVFSKKVKKLHSSELPKQHFDLLPAFDEKHFVQLAIEMVETLNISL